MHAIIETRTAARCRIIPDLSWCLLKRAKVMKAHILQLLWEREKKKTYIAWRLCIVALCPIAHCVQWALSHHASYRMCHSCRQVWLGDSIGCHLNAAMLCWSATSGHVTLTLISEAILPQCPIPSPANTGHCWLPPCSHVFIIITLFFTSAIKLFN